MTAEESVGKRFQRKRWNWSRLTTAAALGVDDTDELPLVVQKPDGEEGSSAGGAV